MDEREQAAQTWYQSLTEQQRAYVSLLAGGLRHEAETWYQGLPAEQRAHVALLAGGQAAPTTPPATGGAGTTPRAARPAQDFINQMNQRAASAPNPLLGSHGA